MVDSNFPIPARPSDPGTSQKSGADNAIPKKFLPNNYRRLLLIEYRYAMTFSIEGLNDTEMAYEALVQHSIPHTFNTVRRRGSEFRTLHLIVDTGKRRRSMTTDGRREGDPSIVCRITTKGLWVLRQLEDGQTWVTGV